MYQVIARKYRPQSFAELIGQEHVRTTLENAIAQRRIAHGYIFSGQRGTGKTTVARILARCLNCIQGPTATPCGVCASCLEIAGGNSPDVIEIDAASNRGINEMRELRENVRYRPARDRYKVFIVDEAHQITSEAFNALLKTLEEPPEWAVFILCTTEVHKIPTTIASRCQQFSFRSVDFAEVMKRMEEICAKEGIEADPEVLSVLAQAGEGSVRDSLSALDQAIACCGTKLDAAEVRGMLGLFSLDSLGEVTRGADGRRLARDAGSGDGAGAQRAQLAAFLPRAGALLPESSGGEGGGREYQADRGVRARSRSGWPRSRSGFSEEDLTRYLQLTLDLFKDLQFSLQPRLHLEIGLLRLIQAGKLVPIEEALADLGSGGSTPVATRKPPTTPPPTPDPPRRQPPTPKPPIPASATGPWKDRLARRCRSNWACSSPPTPLSTPQVTESSGKLHVCHARRLSALHERKGYSEGRAEDRRAADAIRDHIRNAAGAGGAARKSRRTMSPNARWRIPKCGGSRSCSRTRRSAWCVI